MTIINRISAALAPKPQNIYQALANGKVGTSELDEAGKFFTERNVFANGPKEPVRSAKASAAFFNAQINKGNIPKETPNLPSVRGQKTTFGATEIGKKSKQAYNYVAEKTSSLLSKPAVKKGLKYGAIAALVLGALYLGKKAYDAYKNRKAAPVLTPSIHEVKKGDNVWNIAKEDLGGKASNAEIAKRTEELMKLNNLEYANDKGLVIIKPGQQIKLA